MISSVRFFCAMVAAGENWLHYSEKLSEADSDRESGCLLLRVVDWREIERE